MNAPIPTIIPNLTHWQERCDMAAAFRWTARLNMHEAVANHFSLAVNDSGTRFLINPNGRHFSRITASSLVEIDAIRFVPVMRVIVDGAGAPLAPGMRVLAQPSGERSLTGFDGYVEVNAGAADDRLIVGAPGSGCVVDLAGIDLTDEGQGPLVCRTMTIAAGEIERDDTAPAKAKRKTARSDRARRDSPRRGALAAISP